MTLPISYDGELLDELSDYFLLNKDSAVWKYYTYLRLSNVTTYNIVTYSSAKTVTTTTTTATIVMLLVTWLVGSNEPSLLSLLLATQQFSTLMEPRD